MASSNPRSIWTGSITFGLVNIPVKMYSAVQEERIAFRMLHDADKVPLKQKMYCPVENKDVHPEHIVRGYEVEKGQDRILGWGPMGFSLTDPDGFKVTVSGPANPS